MLSILPKTAAYVINTLFSSKVNNFLYVMKDSDHHIPTSTHFLRTHDVYLICLVWPGHILPPHLGAGRVQVLSLTKGCCPSPQVFEHALCVLHCPQEPQLPFTVHSSYYTWWFHLWSTTYSIKKKTWYLLLNSQI